MSYQGKILGAKAENLAAALLTSKKLKVLKRNLRTKYGEIDILAAEGKNLVIVEVKAKTSERFGSALEMITPAKQRKLILLAHELQMTHQIDSVRVDVVTVDNAESHPIIKHHKGIIEFHG